MNNQDKIDQLESSLKEDELAAYVERLRYANKYRQITLSLPEVDAIFNESQPTSLQAYRDEVIERCAEHGLEQLKHMSPTLAIEAIRALKSKP